MTFAIASQSDLEFQRAFEAGDVPATEFSHIAHLRLAYVYLSQGNLRYAEEKMRNALLTFLEDNRLPKEKYHETLTRAWVMAVSYFIDRKRSSSFSEFITNSAQLLDSKVMLTHYSAAALFSDRARAAFVEPDLEAIPC